MDKFPSESQYHQEKYVTNPASLKKKNAQNANPNPPHQNKKTLRSFYHKKIF